MGSLFLSDLHLDPSRPASTTAFETLMAHEARRAEAVYLLGDLFEAYIGDDDDGEIATRVAAATSALRESGVPVFFLRGNRDFLVGPDYARRAGWTLLPDPAVILLEGEATLLMHGDLLCLDDQAYQRLRTQLRDPAWQAAMLAQPLEIRRALAARARTASVEAQSGREEVLGDVCLVEVERLMGLYGVRRLIHGHIHRPGMHRVDLPDGSQGLRVVLGDWYGEPLLLRVDGEGLRLGPL